MATTIDPKSLRVVDLKEELGKRNLAKTGKKDELVARLTEALSAEAAAQSTTTETEETAATEAAEAAETQAVASPPSAAGDVSIPAPAQDTTTTVTETTISASIAEATNELSTSIEQQVQMNNVAESQSLDTNARAETTTVAIEETTTTAVAVLEANNVKSSEDSVKAASPVSSSKDIPSSPKSDQETTLKRKRDESTDAQEEKRSKPEPKETNQVASSAPVEDTSEQNALCIKGFVRPLITKHLQEFIKQYGDVKRFWIDPIKTHCYIIYDTTDQATNCVKNVDGTVYPPTNTGKQVTALLLTSSQASQLMDREQQIADNHGRVNWEKLLEKVLNNETIDEPTPSEQSPGASKRRLGGLEQITRQLQQRSAISAIMDQELQPPTSILDRLSTSDTSKLTMTPPTTSSSSQVSIAGVAASMKKDGKSLDDLFLKTKTNPPLYYLPVDKTIAADRLEAMKNKNKKVD